eukprot:COSAG06_NODE_1335_length_9833_cov_37.824205_8_plen_127_part_00
MTDHAAQNVFITAGKLYVESEPEPEPGPEPGPEPAHGAAGRDKVTATVAGGYDMHVYTQGKTYTITVPMGILVGGEFRADLVHEQPVHAHQPAEKLPTYKMHLSKKKVRAVAATISAPVEFHVHQS